MQHNKIIEFDELEGIKRKLDVFRDKHAVTLKHYYNFDARGFYHRHDEQKKDMSISSTATCVLSLVRAYKWEGQSYPWSQNTYDTVRNLLNAPWKSAELRSGNPFTVAFVVEAVDALCPDIDCHPEGPALRERISEAENKLVRSYKDGSVSVLKYPPSAYLTQLVTRVLLRRKLLSEKLKMDIAEWAQAEIGRQFGLLLAKSKNADVFQLGYCIILAATVVNPTEATPDHSRLLKIGLEKFFEYQLEDGTWPRSQPLFHYPKYGSAYCFDYEFLVQLLECDILRDRLLRFLGDLSRAAYALEDTSFGIEADGQGWSSGHHPQFKGPESWSTASVFHFAHSLDRLVAEAIRRAIFAEIDEPYLPPGKPKSKSGDFAPGFLDCPLRVKGEQKSLKGVLLNKLVLSIAEDARTVENGGSMKSSTPMSAILFGPPGTSKTELTRHISNYLNWPRLSVDPSYFVREGLDKIQHQAERLFKMLSVAERIVVLLDEFDEMVRDRGTATDVLQRFLTTAMLPKLAKIYSSRKILFIVATNYIDTFDLAIRRRGRFDLILQIMPPTTEAKLEFFQGVKGKLEQVELHNDEKIKSQMAKLTFDEFKQLKVRMESLVTREELMEEMNSAEEACTLSVQTETSGGDGKKKWEEICDDQADRVRLPDGS